MAWFGSLSRKVQLGLQMPVADWRLVARSWLLLLLTDLGLRLMPFRRLQRSMSNAAPAGVSAVGDTAATVDRVQRLVDTAARHHLYPMTCLRRALVLQQLLAEHGIFTSLEIGVRKEAGALAGHAWLVHSGRPIGQPESIGDRYLPLARVCRDD